MLQVTWEIDFIVNSLDPVLINTVFLSTCEYIIINQNMNYRIVRDQAGPEF